ncbi:TIGR03936 family radical SAM-associated protein [Fusibacter ferrireducens]|uniref:DUF2344 domain-containing protein n=1 Tax=Fusibacter ferrireducens TaxID=2785058 RepID=A0ABR9ZWP7_9FIRM|nr:TIGR03936 family radical SAM-associated protein [Fusibacter ferrireducens]MBF4694874.1 DUF2344 domain-containing protein [Fusibacter ferrireducens]
METLRIVYTKQKYMRYLSHLELMKLFERVFRFQKLPLKFSEGFNPHPKMTFAAPLSVGFSSQAEIMEVQLNERIDLEHVLQMKFPDGIQIIKAKYVDSKKALMASIDFSEYMIRIDFGASVSEYPFEERAESFLNQEAIHYEKKTKKGTMKTVNALELVKSFSVIFKEENELILRATLASNSSMGSLNPELLANLFLNFCKNEKEIEQIEVERINLFMTVDKKLVSLYEL